MPNIGDAFVNIKVRGYKLLEKVLREAEKRSRQFAENLNRALREVDESAGDVAESMERVAKETRKAGDAASDASNEVKGLDARFGRTAEKLEQSTEGVRKFQGALTGILGIAAAVFAIFFKLGNAINATTEEFKSGEDKVREFAETLKASGATATEQADAIRERYAELTDELQNLSVNAETAGDAIRKVSIPGRKDRIREEINELQKYLEQVNKVEMAERERALAREQAASRDVIKGENEALQLQLEQLKIQKETDPIQKIILQNNMDLNELKKQQLELTKEIQQEDLAPERDQLKIDMLKERIALLNEQRTIITDIAQQEINNINDQRAAEAEAQREKEEKEEQARLQKEQKEKEALEKKLADELKVVNQIREANQQALDDLQQSFQDTIASINSQAGSFSDLTALVDSIRNEIRQLRGR